MNSLSFLNTPLLYGMLTASIPIIIHLLFRRRVQHVQWAPMKYLKLSIRRNRRRIRLEQLLLLALRILLLVLLFFMVSRPLMHPSGLGGLLAGGSRISQVIVLDDSLSMGYSVRGKSAFSVGKSIVSEILDGSGVKDRVTVLLTSQLEQPLFRSIEGAGSSSIQDALERIEVSDTSCQWDSTFTAVDELIQGANYPIRDVIVVTDLRRSGWSGDVVKVGERWLGRRVRLRIFDVGTDDTSNVSLKSFESGTRAPLVNTPTEYFATVTNNTNGQIEGVEGILRVDGEPTSIRLPNLSPGQDVKIPLATTFQTGGLHSVSFELPDDNLVADNHGFLVTDVRESLRMVLVDGEPSSEPLRGEVDFVALALSLGVGTADSWQVEVTTDSDWAIGSLGEADLVVLGNVSTLTPDQAGELRRLVTSGCGLMIFVGDQIDVDVYNKLLGDPTELMLPGLLETAIDDPINGLLVELVSGSPLEALTQLSPAVLERIPVSRYMRIQNVDELPEGSRILARWNNAESSPAVLDRPYGRGRVILWTTTADRQWSQWPTEPSYVMAVRESSGSIARSPLIGDPHAAGDRLVWSLPPGDVAVSPSMSIPGKSEGHAVGVENVSDGENQVATLSFDSTQNAGVYRLSWTDTQNRDQQAWFGVSPDSRESVLRRISNDDVKSMLGGLEVEIVTAAGLESAMAVRGQEIWRTLALCLLGLLVVESCFATWVGRQG